MPLQKAKVTIPPRDPTTSGRARADLKWTKDDVLAIRAVAAGKANAGQQKQAIDYIMRIVCGVWDYPYRPDQRMTDIMLGRLRVGQDIAYLLQTAEIDERKAK